MSMFMGKALSLFNEPAALYEWPSLEFLAINDAGRILAGRLPERDGGDPQMSWVGLNDEDVKRRIESAREHVIIEHTEWGIIVFSLLEPQEYHPRPTLMLTSVHPFDEQVALVDHHRLRTTLMLNERSETSLRLMETALQQMSAAHEAQVNMLKEVNEAVSLANEKSHRFPEIGS